MRLLPLSIRRYGVQFVGVGSLKFAADVLGFAGPLLLNRLVAFIEDAGEDVKWGYLYAALLTASAAAAALCNVHFNLLVSELNLKVRASVVSAVYRFASGSTCYRHILDFHTCILRRHTLDVSSADLRGRYRAGEVINFMSTDTDRIVNFASSFHAAWSLPFQFVVTLALLYGQVGLSSLAGVALTLLMVPLNRWVAKAIGAQSTKFMSAKDGRVGIMAEVLGGMTSVKLFGWEGHFFTKVDQKRAKELKHLAWRKYLVR